MFYIGISRKCNDKRCIGKCCEKNPLRLKPGHVWFLCLYFQEKIHVYRFKTLSTIFYYKMFVYMVSLSLYPCNDGTTKYNTKYKTCTCNSVYSSHRIRKKNLNWNHVQYINVVFNNRATKYCVTAQKQNIYFTKTENICTYILWNNQFCGIHHKTYIRN